MRGRNRSSFVKLMVAGKNTLVITAWRSICPKCMREQPKFSDVMFRVVASITMTARLLPTTWTPTTASSRSNANSVRKKYGSQPWAISRITKEVSTPVIGLSPVYSMVVCKNSLGRTCSRSIWGPTPKTNPMSANSVKRSSRNLEIWNNIWKVM